jgi:hypothetical protein
VPAALYLLSTGGEGDIKETVSTYFVCYRVSSDFCKFKKCSITKINKI